MAKGNNKEKALVALLNNSTITEAAKACGLSEETLYRYLRDKDFKKSYQEARRSLVENSLSELQRSSSEAVKTLKRNLNCGNPFAENSAAKSILDNSIKALELGDILQRLEKLEDATQTEN